jgi:hypothetical protein
MDDEAAAPDPTISDKMISVLVNWFERLRGATFRTISNCIHGINHGEPVSPVVVLSVEIGREASDATKPGDEPGSVRAAFSACSNV